MSEDSIRKIDLDATNWNSESDFYDALLGALGAPPWYAKNINALVDAMVYEGLDKIEPPYLVRIHRLARAPRNVRSEVEFACDWIRSARQERLALHGEDPDVSMEWEP